MELPGWEYFYSLAALSLAFAGFTSIVVVLRQGTGKPLSQFHLLLTRLFIELGLMATAFAILAPTLAICGIRQIMVWQISSAIMLVILVPWLIAYPFRRKAAAPKERMPLRVYIMLSSYTLYLFPLR
jgi:purine-cytosine permease-like protein